MVSRDYLQLFEMPSALIEPALKMCRRFNTCLDYDFYDVPAFAEFLHSHGEDIGTVGGKPDKGAPSTLDLSAFDNPEGAILVIDASQPPFVLRFDKVPDFLEWHGKAEKQPTTVCISGVGSSALGSAALAWDISRAIHDNVIAIVPGYGVADCILQALGGWFGFGFYNAFNTKSNVQELLAMTVPETAWIGRNLSASAPGSKKAPTGAPIFQTGSGSSDVLHALLQEIALKRLIGHSKGALAIANAIRSLHPDERNGLQVVTLGCPIAAEFDTVTYRQFLGLFDALGQLNSWNNLPDTWLPSGHSTNMCLPLSMDVERLSQPTGRG
ncbi:MAG TPA: hypothetical protein VGH23_10425 [Rhizomicrobium sp.]|jgi:hypothetical protein